HKPKALYTFGCPKVGDQTFCDSLKKVPTFRFENCSDIVPTLPAKLIGYRHPGTHYFFDKEGDLHIDPSDSTRHRHKALGALHYAKGFPIFKKDHVPARCLSDHAIPNYTATIAKHLKGGA
ncbi:hypothetical protein JKY72_05965, partial [Candidatus Gracilibacteria bacterium]|nr:hypothetical protein [Candidatus Gracilibacteria bacterium]